MLTEVILYGPLGEKFGRTHHFAVSSVAQAMSALAANLPGFRQHMYENSAPGYYVIAGKNQGIPEEELTFSRQMPVLKIVPGVEGRKATGGFQMIMGAVLMAAAVALCFVPGFQFSPIPGYIFAAGASMFLGGVSAYLSVSPSLDSSTKADQPKSYGFDGPQNTVAQGGPVGVIYGMLEVGSVVGAMGIYAEDIQVNVGGGRGPDTDPSFHFSKPDVDVTLKVPTGDTGASVSIDVLLLNGTPPYSIDLQQDGGGLFKFDAPSSKVLAVDASGKVPVGSYTLTLYAQDSDPTVHLDTTKNFVVTVTSDDLAPTLAPIYIPPKG